MYICVYKCTCFDVLMCVYACTECVWLCTCVDAYIYICVHCMCICAHMCMCVYMYKALNLYMCEFEHHTYGCLELDVYTVYVCICNVWGSAHV